MPSNNESTMKWKVDVTQLKAAMQEAKRAINQANAEFKTATAGMDKWSKSASGLEAKLDQLNKVLPAQKRQLEVLEAQYEDTVKKMGENSQAAADLKIKIEEQKATITKTETSINKYNDQLADMKKQQAEADSATGKLSKTIEEQEEALKELKKAYANAVLQYGENSDEAKDLAKQIDNLSGELSENKTKLREAEQAADDLDKSLDEAGDSADEAANGGFTVLKGALANLVAEGISRCIDAMKDFAKETIEVGRQFDSTMSEVAAISGATADDLNALREKAKEMGSTTKFTASEAAEAFTYMAMAGWKTEDMLSGIDGILNLAAASGSDLATASDIVTDALTAMGYSAEDAGRLADVMAAASSNANTNVEMMGATFQYAAPLVGALGYNMEDTAVAIGLMANAGIKGEKAGTALRSIMTRLSTDAGASSKSLGALGTLTEELGVQFYNLDGTTRPLNDVLMDARKAWQGLSAEQQTSYGKVIAGQEAMSGWLAIMNAAPEDVEKLTGAINDCDGAAENMAATMLDNLGGDMTILGSQLEGVQIALYEKFEPALRSGVEVLSKLLDGVSWLIDHGDTIVAVLTGMATAVGTYLAYTTAVKVMTKGWQSLAIVQKAVAAGQALLNVVMAMNPIGLVIAAIAGLVAAFVVLWKKSEAFREFWINLWENIVEIASTVWEAITGFFSAAWDKIQEIWGSVTEWFSNLWESIKEIFSVVADWINENVFQPIIEYFQPLITFFTEAWNIIKELAEGCWLAIKAIWSVVSTWINEHVVQPVKDFFSGLWSAVSSAASTAWSAIKSVWSAVSGWFKGTIIEPVQNFFSNMWAKLKTGAGNAWAGIKGVFTPVADWFKDKFSKAWQKVKDVFSTGGKVFDGIKEGITNAFKTVVNAIIRGINKVIAIPFNAINDILDKIRNVSIAGAKPFAGLISRFTVPQIPELVRGGILKRGQVGYLEGTGAEAVVPLERNKYWIAAVVKELINQMDMQGLRTGVNGSLNGMVGSKTQNITFNQTINSPKAVDRLTLYRETNSLLFSAKVGLANV